MNRRGFGRLTLLMFLVVAIAFLYVASVGPVFGYYVDRDWAEVSKPMPRMIFKMYVPLFRLLPEMSSRCLAAYNVSTIEADFMVHQEELKPMDAPLPLGTP